MEPGEQFGRWSIVTGTLIKQGRLNYVVCRCRCGTLQRVSVQHLRSGASKSCGCLRREVTARTKRKHGWAKTRLHTIWYNMHYRCEVPDSASYKRYGGRGISVCTEWSDFLVFKDWALAHGYTTDLTIERRDNDGNYCPENCCWATQSENLRNTSQAIRLTAWEETKPLVAWVEDPRCSVPYEVLRQRVKSLGWEHERAISTPLLTKGGKSR